MAIYLDYAASTPLAPEVLEAMMPFLNGHYGNPSSIHNHGRTLKATIEGARRRISECLGCAPGSIIFTSGGTEADNLALKSAVHCFPIQQVITAPTEHHAVLHPAERLQADHQIDLQLLTVDENGHISLEELREKLALKPKGSSFVSIMHANNETGVLLDLEAVAELCAEFAAIMHSDTVQTIGQLPLDLYNNKVHFITAAAHKFYGPQGMGFLYCAPEVLLPPQICGGGQERNRRSGTENVAGIVGLSEALCNSRERAEAYRSRLWELKQYFWNELQVRFPGIQVNGPFDIQAALPTILNVAFPGEGAESFLLYQLDMKGISVSGGSACSSGSSTGSHVLRAMGLPAERVAHSIRFSFGRNTTKGELDETLEVLETALAPVVGKLKN